MDSMLDGMGWDEGQRGAGEQLFLQRGTGHGSGKGETGPSRRGGPAFAAAAHPPSQQIHWQTPSELAVTVRNRF